MPPAAESDPNRDRWREKKTITKARRKSFQGRQLLAPRQAPAMIAKGTRGDSSRVVVYNDLWTHHTTDTRGIERNGLKTAKKHKFALVSYLQICVGSDYDEVR